MKWPAHAWFVNGILVTCCMNADGTDKDLRGYEGPMTEAAALTDEDKATWEQFKKGAQEYDKKVQLWIAMREYNRKLACQKLSES